MRPARCYFCKGEAEWAMQYMPGDVYKPTFTLLGSHYRGFKVTKVCGACKDKVQAKIKANDTLSLKDICDGIHSISLEPLG